MRKMHVVSERYVCDPCLKGQHGDCERVVGGMLNPPRACHCQRYKHNVLIREQQPVKKHHESAPKEGSSGELAAFDLLTAEGFKFDFNKYLWTPYHVPFKPDFRIFNMEYPANPDVIYEVQGGYHRRTRGGKVANNQMKKDRIKKNCLIATGYAYTESTDSEIKSKKKASGVIAMIRDALAHPEKYMQIDPLVRAELEENKR